MKNPINIILDNFVAMLLLDVGLDYIQYFLL